MAEGNWSVARGRRKNAPPEPPEAIQNSDDCHARARNIGLADRLDPERRISGGRSEGDKHHLVMFGIDNLAQGLTQLLKTQFIERALENGKLKARAEGFHRLLDAAKAFVIRDVVADEIAGSAGHRGGGI